MAQKFKPGEVVSRSGVYRVIHKEHRQTHFNELKAGDIFPSCKHCKDKVRFEFVSSPDKSVSIKHGFQ